MSHLSRQHTGPLTLERRLSIEQTYQLADTARRKSSSEQTRHDLRLRVGHAYMLEALEHVIRNSPPPSPRQSSLQPSKSITWAGLETSTQTSPPGPEVDEYGYEYDDGQEDLGGLSLMRTESRRP